MNARWYKISPIEKMEAPERPGVYIIMTMKAKQRIGRKDEKGILYIGESYNLENRLNLFWNAMHPASGLIWDHPKIAKYYLGANCLNTGKVGERIGKLYAKVYAPVKGGKEARIRLERALLYAYMYRFGEPPPLNSKISGRWDEKPKAEDFNWAKKII